MIRAIIGLAAFLIVGAAEARTFTDTFGRTVAVDDSCVYSVSDSRDGFTATIKPLIPCDDAGVLRTLNDMRPSYFPPIPVLITTISKTAFLALMEARGVMPAILAASHADDNVGLWLLIAQAHDSIDLLDPMTKQGLDYMVSKGLMSIDDETAILRPLVR